MTASSLAKTSLPWLLYAYPWMPYPRRVIIYLREKGIPETLVRVVHVSDPSQGNQAVDSSFPPRPEGSLPILAAAVPEEETIYIRQSLAIIHFLEEVCEKRLYGFDVPGIKGSFSGNDIVERARINEVAALADAATTEWNPVRLFGTGTSGFNIPEASKESLRWVRRTLGTIERFWRDRDMSSLRKNQSDRTVTIADLAVYQFLEFTKDCYGMDMTDGSGEIVKGVYGDDVIETSPKLKEFYEAFSTRNSAVRDESKGEVPPEYALKAMRTWNW